MWSFTANSCDVAEDEAVSSVVLLALITPWRAELSFTTSVAVTSGALQTSRVHHGTEEDGWQWNMLEQQLVLILLTGMFIIYSYYMVLIPYYTILRMPSEKLWKCKSWSFLPVTFFRYLFETTHEIMYHKCLIFLFFYWFPVSKHWVVCMSRLSLVLFHLIVLLKIMSLTPVRSLDTYLVLIQRRVSKDYSIQIRSASKWFCCSMIFIYY